MCVCVLRNKGMGSKVRKGRKREICSDREIIKIERERERKRRRERYPTPSAHFHSLVFLQFLAV